jgi:hypothetical protein
MIKSQGQHWPMEKCGPQAKRTRLSGRLIPSDRRPNYTFSKKATSGNKRRDTSRLSPWNVDILGPKFNSSTQGLRQAGLENSNINIITQNPD